MTPIFLITIGPDDENQDFRTIYRECFGTNPATPLSNEDSSKAASTIRDTLEYWITLKMSENAQPETLILIDGTLRVSHASHDPILQQIIEVTGKREVYLCAVSKQTKATWGGGYPLIPAVNGLAYLHRHSTPWWVKIPLTILDHTQFLPWQHGDIYIARLNEHARAPLKIELPHDYEEKKVQKVMEILTACSDDGRLLGYPYPLIDAHQTVVIERSLVDQIQQDLYQGISKRGVDFKSFQMLFGDYHDDFRRY